MSDKISSNLIYTTIFVIGILYILFFEALLAQV